MTLTPGSTGAERERTPAVAVDQTAWHTLAADEACARLDVDPAAGLDDAEVRRRRAQVGPNKLAVNSRADAIARAAVLGFLGAN